MLWAMRVKRLISLTIFAANQRVQGKNRKNSRRHRKKPGIFAGTGMSRGAVTERVR
jgi:hypothetical protein